mmetsp:Transcript_14082/g.27347  ORF Transcript_14082/g.27347 Transcript_14082/m.27347 type:complete len:230 (+) Transcript_14082:444-1133(+)
MFTYTNHFVLRRIAQTNSLYSCFYACLRRTTISTFTFSFSSHVQYLRLLQKIRKIAHCFHHPHLGNPSAVTAMHITNWKNQSSVTNLVNLNKKTRQAIHASPKCAACPKVGLPERDDAKVERSDCSPIFQSVISARKQPSYTKRTLHSLPKLLVPTTSLFNAPERKCVMIFPKVNQVSILSAKLEDPNRVEAVLLVVIARKKMFFWHVCRAICASWVSEVDASVIREVT